MENFFDDQAEPRRSKYPDSIFELAEVEGHPYLHLFPGLKWTAEKAGPFLRNSDLGRTFIYNPFEGITANKYLRSHKINKTLPPQGREHALHLPPMVRASGRRGNRRRNQALRQARHHRMDEYRGVPGKDEKGSRIWISTHSPHWFGKNSTRGVLSEAVAEALSQAIKPGAEDHDLLVRIKHSRNRMRPTEYGTGWSLAEYLRTPIIAEKGQRGLRGQGEQVQPPDAHHPMGIPPPRGCPSSGSPTSSGRRCPSGSRGKNWGAPT